MKKVLIAYDSRTGKTEHMVEYITKGIRMSGDVITPIMNTKNQGGQYENRA
jgi:flavodoxin